MSRWTDSMQEASRFRMFDRESAREAHSFERGGPIAENGISEFADVFQGGFEMNRDTVIVGLLSVFLTAGCADLGNYLNTGFPVGFPVPSESVPSDMPVSSPPPAPPATYRTTGTRDVDGPITIDRINEDAFVEYRDNLRDAVKMISVLANPQMANPWVVSMISTQMSTSIIEIEQWSASDRGIAWQSMGNEIDSLTRLFEDQRERIVADAQYAPDFRASIERIPLLTRN